MTSVSFPSENSLGECPGVLQGNPNCTMGLIVLQEWFGMNEQILERAKDLAERGNFVTLVPDLYRGKVAINREEAGHLSTELDWDGAIKDIQGAARFLLRRGYSKVGVTGFCMGGALSFNAAALVPEFSAAAPFYGIPRPRRCDLTRIQIPVQAHFGELDDIVGFSSPEDVKALQEEMVGKSNFELFMYPAGHAFTNPNGRNFNKGESELALGRMIAFMQRNLSVSNL